MNEFGVASSSVEPLCFDQCKIHGTVIKVVLGTQDNLFWSGDYYKRLVVEGRHCCLTDYEPLEDKLSFPLCDISDSFASLRHFAEELNSSKAIECPYSPTISELVSFRPASATNNKLQSTSKLKKNKCLVPGCNLYVEEKKMLQHVSGHIVREELPSNSQRCGFCGKYCIIALVKTSGDGKNTTLGPASDCLYAVPLKLAWMKKFTAANPSTNHPMKCPLCPPTSIHFYWSYNMVSHVKEMHVGQDFSQFIISETEANG